MGAHAVAVAVDPRVAKPHRRGLISDAAAAFPASQSVCPPVADLAQLLAVFEQAVARRFASVVQRDPRVGFVYRPVEDVSPSILAIAWSESSSPSLR